MICEKIVFLLVCFGCFFGKSVSQIPQGTPCEQPNGALGVCISIYNCDILLELLRTQSNNPQVRNYLQRSACGRVGNTQLVCCPQIRRPATPLPEPVTQAPQVRNPTGSTLTLPKVPVCGRSNRTDPRIVGGYPVSLGALPWMVVLGYRNSKNPSQPRWLCGGTLITEKHILTAAHCVHNRNDLYLARVGDLDLYDDDDSEAARNIPLIKAKIHEDYSNTEYTNDIAILTLNETVNLTEIHPVCLPEDEPFRSRDYVSKMTTVAGWGSLYFNGPSSSSLQAVQLPVVSNSECQRAFGNRAVIDDRIICAGYVTGESKDSCKGDSGGPLLYSIRENRTATFYQIGVVSYGFKCAEPGYPGVYTRVTNFIEWIKRNLN